MQTKKQNKLIGEYLVEKDLITEDQLSEILKIQKKNKATKIGELLRAEGYINNLDFFESLAEFKNIKFIELQNYKLPENLILNNQIDEYLVEGYLPFSYDENSEKYKIAVTNLDDGFLNYLKATYNDFEVFVTSPLDISRCINLNFNSELTDYSTENLHIKLPNSSAKNIMLKNSDKYIFSILGIIFLILLINKSFFVNFAYAINCFYFTAIISKIYFLFSGYKNEMHRKNDPQILPEIENYPIYSILIPLFKESEITLKRLIDSILNLDYPREKLDIKLIVEEGDFNTIENIKKLKPINIFEIIKVPFSLPQTKPKACNYAINFCKGEYITIYDAEDAPEKDQLKKVLAVYRADKENKIGAVQARLTYYNKYENFLTKCFTIEYYSWFNMMLRGLHHNNFPIPLGGTSNHFRLKTLKALYSWDPYNVTEDADLGVRIFFKNYQTKLIDSYTFEEATVNLKQWLKQRMRWIKGYMQTFIVYSRNFKINVKKFGVKKYLGFFYFVAAPAIVFITAPIITVFGLYHYFNSDIIDLNLQVFSFFNLFVSILLHTILGVFVVIKNKWYKMLPASFLFGFYWFLHCVAAPLALIELVFKPHHWNKTEHGKSKYL